jgi:hypothetical protein
VNLSVIKTKAVAQDRLLAVSHLPEHLVHSPTEVHLVLSDPGDLFLVRRHERVRSWPPGG